jgi:hypothetical protein
MQGSLESWEREASSRRAQAITSQRLGVLRLLVANTHVLEENS